MIEFKKENGKILTERESISVYGEYDVVVVGGGMAGVGAALAAAKGLSSAIPF